MAPTPKSKERSVITSSIASTPRTNKLGIVEPTSRALRVIITYFNFFARQNVLIANFDIFQGVPVANIRHRRSKSTDERWLEHRAPNPVPLGTIFQPYYKARKSITKLTDAKDLVNAKSSKYCLVAQGADTDGEVETRLYKGNVIPTCGGGAQVVFNDVECLKQRSPVTSPRRKRPSVEEATSVQNPDEVTSRCSIGIQGKKTKY